MRFFSVFFSAIPLRPPFRLCPLPDPAAQRCSRVPAGHGAAGQDGQGQGAQEGSGTLLRGAQVKDWLESHFCPKYENRHFLTIIFRKAAEVQNSQLNEMLGKVVQIIFSKEEGSMQCKKNSVPPGQIRVCRQDWHGDQEPAYVQKVLGLLLQAEDQGGRHGAMPRFRL